MNSNQGKLTRFATFKRVLAEAAKKPPISPAFTAYNAAKTDAERRNAYAAMTAADRDALMCQFTKDMNTYVNAEAAKRRADDAAFAARRAAADSVARSAERTRIANLPPNVRLRVELMQKWKKVAGILVTCVCAVLVVTQVSLEVGGFGYSLVHDWVAWALMFGALFIMLLIFMLSVHGRVIVAVAKALPAAIYAAFSRGSNGVSPRKGA